MGNNVNLPHICVLMCPLLTHQRLMRRQLWFLFVQKHALAHTSGLGGNWYCNTTTTGDSRYDSFKCVFLVYDVRVSPSARCLKWQTPEIYSVT